MESNSRWKLVDMIKFCNKEWLRNFRLETSIEEDDNDSVIAIVNVRTLLYYHRLLYKIQNCLFSISILTN